MDAIVAQLKEKDLLKFDDGRYIMWAPGVEIPLTVVKVIGLIGTFLFLIFCLNW